MPNPAPQVFIHPSLYRVHAECRTCGWTGPDRATRAVAEQDGDRHTTAGHH